MTKSYWILPITHAASTVPMAEKAQQLPHWPWFFTGVMIDLQSLASGFIVCNFSILNWGIWVFWNHLYNQHMGFEESPSLQVYYRRTYFKIAVCTYIFVIQNWFPQHCALKFFPSPVRIVINSLEICRISLFIFGIMFCKRYMPNSKCVCSL